MKSYNDITALIAFAVVTVVMLYSCATTGYEAMDKEMTSLDHLRAERSERIYGSLYQYEQFKKEQGR